jgi:hypothetical protein
MATPSNSFMRVDAPDPRAVTVIIRQDGENPRGEVEGPAPADGAPLNFGRDGSLGAQEALAVGCQLANELGRDVVVIDEGRQWRPAWGRLDQA